jgi:hypothetical protein
MADTRRDRHRPWYRWLKAPLKLLLILTGFGFEFILEAPFRIALWIAGEHRPH